MKNQMGKVTVGNIMEFMANKMPDHEALVYSEYGLRYTYSEFYEACRKVAKAFMSMGIERGDHVAIWATNVPQWVMAQFGTAMIGATLVTVNTLYKNFEVEYVLKQSDSMTLILIQGHKDSSYPDIINEICPELKDSRPGGLKAKRLPKLKNIVYIGEKTYPGMFAWDKIIEMGEKVSDSELDARGDSLKPNDVINMQYTSGTTGFPKGVMLTHANLIGNAYSVADCMKFTPADKLCIPVPLFHCFGCSLGTMTCLVSGATMVPIERFNPKVVLETIEKERCTALHGVPTMFITELEVLKEREYDLSALRTGIMAGANCPTEVMRAVMEQMGMKEITITYGQTESSPGITMTRTDDSLERRVNTVGKALPNVEVKITDPDTGKDVLPGVQGEICTRGYHVMKGYYKMPEATQAVIDRDGWLHTGDLGVMDEEGYCRVTGRIKEMIIRGGENIYPREIEEFLYTFEKVKDVQVVGVPSEKYGEEVMAFIQLKEGVFSTEEEIQAFCKGGIASYKVPRYVSFVVGYPTTASGKVQKYKLREQAIETLGLENTAVL